MGVRKPVRYLILTGDAVHNFLGGLGIASTFLIDPRAGIIAWIAAVAHEVPQELGDFGVLVHWGLAQASCFALEFPLCVDLSGRSYPRLLLCLPAL